ncbi:HdeA/HdeB family chaperone [Rhodoplanes azumiensis]|uniref:HdeA/HdeB family chaperone n=1 Tax=Rhodoplanes azumiensis TaxID=1897628 RepID=A0ABW5ALA3_9BRAD
MSSYERSITAHVAGFVAAWVMAAPQPVWAQTTIDVAKISCEQWQTYKVASPDQIALWISGYLAGKRGTTVIEVQTFRETNLKKVKDRCFREPKMLVMDAVEKEIGAAR